MRFSILVYIMMPLSILLAFMWAPPTVGHGESGRIIFFHVPLAWVSTLAFVYAGIASLLHLARTKGPSDLPEKAHASASIGMLFCLLTVVTGSIWAKITWGSYWNWDPRETTIVFLLLIYVAYFSLYSSLKGNDNRGRISSAYLIFAMITVPLFIFILPRVLDSLHPQSIINTERKVALDDRIKITLAVSCASFTLLYAYILGIINRIIRIEKGMVTSGGGGSHE